MANSTPIKEASYCWVACRASLAQRSGSCEELKADDAGKQESAEGLEYDGGQM